jgi:hypothetical protein
MKRNHLITLVLAALVLGGIAYLTSQKDNIDTPSRMGQLLLKDLPIDDIAAVVMSGPEGTTRIEKSTDGWIVPSKYGYYANFEKLQRAVLELSEAKVEHEIDVNEAQKNEMNITADSSRIQLLGAEDNLLAEIILGDTRENAAAATAPYGGMPTGRFVSVDGGETVVVISEVLNDPSRGRAINWVDTEIPGVKASDLITINITGPDREPVNFTRKTINKLELANLKEGEEFDDTNIYSVENALSYLHFSDIADPALSDDDLGMVDPIVYEATAIRGTVYTVKIGGSPEGSEDRYARISVAYKKQEKVDPEEDDAAKQQREKEDKETAESAEILNAKLAPWTFVIPSYKAESMCKVRSDFIKQPEENPETETAPATDEQGAEGDQQ